MTSAAVPVLQSTIAPEGPSMTETPVPTVPARTTTSTDRRMMRDHDNPLVTRRTTVRPEDPAVPLGRYGPDVIGVLTSSGLRVDRPAVGFPEDDRHRDRRSDSDEVTLFRVDGAVDSNRRVESPSPPK